MIAPCSRLPRLVPTFARPAVAPLVLLLVAASAGCRPAPQAPCSGCTTEGGAAGNSGAEGVTALVGGTVLRPGATDGADALRNATVVMKEGRITACGPAQDVAVPPGARVIDTKGQFVLPGFVDAHVHFFQSGGPATRPDVVPLTKAFFPYAEEARRVRQELPETLRAWLASGVTSVADDGGPFWNFEVRAFAAAVPKAPRVLVAGPLISTRDLPTVHRMDLEDPPIIAVNTPDEARTLARRQLERHPDFVKVWFIHRRGDDLAAQEAVARAAGDEAHAAGVRLMVHAMSLAVAKAALRAGADILVHSVVDLAVDDELVSLARARKVVYVPTLYVGTGYLKALGGTWRPTEAEERFAVRRAVADLQRVGGQVDDEGHVMAPAPALSVERAAAQMQVAQGNLRRVRAAGITIAVGTDAGNIGTVHGPSYFRELDLMSEAGLTNDEVLRAATRGGAVVLGLERELALEPGGFADLVVLSRDPRVTLPTGLETRWVVARGHVFAIDELRAPVAPVDSMRK